MTLDRRNTWKKREDFAEALEVVMKTTKLTPSQIADYLGVHYTTIYRWINQEAAPHSISATMTKLGRLACVGWRERQGSPAKGQVVKLEGLE